MVESRWLRWVGPGVVALGAVGVIASTTLGAGAAVGAPRLRRAAERAGRGRARHGPRSARRPARGAWFRLDPVLDGDGALSGQRLSLGLDGERAARSLDLAPESFAAGPFGRIVLVGSG